VRHVLPTADGDCAQQGQDLATEQRVVKARVLASCARISLIRWHILSPRRGGRLLALSGFDVPQQIPSGLAWDWPVAPTCDGDSRDTLGPAQGCREDLQPIPTGP